METVNGKGNAEKCKKGVKTSRQKLMKHSDGLHTISHKKESTLLGK